MDYSGWPIPITGYLFYIPFMHFNVCMPNFIHFCSYILNLCLKFTRINKSYTLLGFTGRPRDGPENTRRFGSLGKALYFEEYLYRSDSKLDPKNE